MTTTETILFKLACFTAAISMVCLDLNLGWSWSQGLRFTSLRRAYVEQCKREHEERNEFDPGRHCSFIILCGVDPGNFDLPKIMLI